MPKRIQRKRTKGWRMPTNTVNVCRPTIYGNPFRHEDQEYAVKAFRLYCRAAMGLGTFNWVRADNINQHVERKHLPVEIRIIRSGPPYYDKISEFPNRRGFSQPLTLVQMPDMLKLCRASIERIRGKDVACFCRLDECCHADVLLELANR